MFIQILKNVCAGSNWRLISACFGENGVIIYTCIHTRGGKLGAERERSSSREREELCALGVALSLMAVCWLAERSPGEFSHLLKG